MTTQLDKNSYLNFADLFTATGDYEFFDTPDFPDIPLNDNDIYVTIDSEYLGRLDLVAFDYYGDPNLWWFIALANKLDDLPTQAKIGLRLRIPSNQTLGLYLKRTGNGTSI